MQGGTSHATIRHFILGTAGHIDHGKTSLVRALTGTDPDRLPEEKRRGMTIELGFAAFSIGDTQFGVVDVPGHERFVRTMVAGATGIDIAVLVVAADDSVMPQTREHVDILNLLGVRRGVVALTKIDVVDDSMVELVSEEIRELLAETTLAGATICPVSSITGKGLDELKETILSISREITTAEPLPPFRMAVDRAFVVQGRGTVVTGSVLRGTVSGGDTLEILPAQKECRVRDLQSHGTANANLGRGQRAALNLSGVDVDEVPRGVELATPGYLQPSKMIDVSLSSLAPVDKPLKSGVRARLELGTREIPVRLILYANSELAGRERAYAQLRSGEWFSAVYGQRFILRDESATRTLGGGVVLRPVGIRLRRVGKHDVDALARMESDDSVARVREVLRSAGFVQLSGFQLCARAGIELHEVPPILSALRASAHCILVPGSDAFIVPEVIDDLALRVAAWLERHHKARPDTPGRGVDSVLGWLERVTKNRALARPLLELFQSRKNVKLLGKFVCLPAFAPAISAADEKLLAKMIEEIRRGKFQPPTPAEFGEANAADRKRLQKLVTLAVAQGDLISMDGSIYLHGDTETELRRIVADFIQKNGGVTVAQIREALESSRKFVVPFVEYLDRIGFTKRTGDLRILS